MIPGIITFKRALLKLYINSLGWRTNRKLVIIESDDWGSIRMPSLQVYNELLTKGFAVDKLSYLKYDSLESNKDLECLFEVLYSFKDINNNHPVITANTIMTNPDFKKIRDTNFKEYHYELFTETLKRYPEHDRVFDLYKLGIAKKIFYPQLHGMEHLNVKRWMKALADKKSNARIAFDYGMFDLSVSHTTITKDSFVDALSPEDEEEIKSEKTSLLKASELFESTFGYVSKTFIAPCYIWRPELEETLLKMGVKNIQSGVFQKIPEVGKVSSFSKKLHYTGQHNHLNQTYTVRNCSFEPTTFKRKDIVDSCLRQISSAFKNAKPAIITSHRLNYIGNIVESNRIQNIELLERLLKATLTKWPEVEYITSEELAEIIIKGKD
jgi:hypothetical protein